MKDFVAENDRILNEWRKKYIEENQPLYPECPDVGVYFANDGIMFKGDFEAEPKRYDNGQTGFRWKRNPNLKENELWANAPLRILFLTKDQNTSGDVAWDVRSETFRYPDFNYKPEDLRLHTQSAFIRNLVYSLYGIMKTTSDSPMKSDVFSNEKALEFADKQIFARINCKKEVGEDKCHNDILKKAIDNDKICLKEQIINLDADIFFCCGYSESTERTGSHILNFLNEIGYNFVQDSKEDTGEWIYYDKKNNKVAINSYHLSYSAFDYNGLITAYSKFLKNYPNFMKSHRE